MSVTAATLENRVGKRRPSAGWSVCSQGLMIPADVHYLGTEQAEDAIVYVAELDDGAQVTLSPSEFAKRFGWQNDPKRVQLSIVREISERNGASRRFLIDQTGGNTGG